MKMKNLQEKKKKDPWATNNDPTSFTLIYEIPKNTYKHGAE